MDFLLGSSWTTVFLVPCQDLWAMQSAVAATLPPILGGTCLGDTACRSARSTRSALASLEDRLALLREGTLRLLGILGARQGDGLRLLVAVALVQRQIFRQGEGTLCSARRQRHLARNLPCDAERGAHQLRAGHAGGGDVHA